MGGEDIMKGKIIIAKYNEGYILASDYRKTYHEEIFCPYCNPPIRMTCVQNSFFRAMPGIKHNCDKLVPVYLDPDWKGRRMVEIAGDKTGKLDITIDINGIEFSSIEKKNVDGKNYNKKDEQSKAYYTYKEYTQVFRDVVRNVAQMKRILIKNSAEDLQGITFRFKIDDTTLSISEVLKTPDELNVTLHNQMRFLIFKVNSVIKSKNGSTVYINAYDTNEISVTATLEYLEDVKKLRIKEEDYLIVFGKVVYSKSQEKYFIRLSSDANIEKFKEKDIIDLFIGRTLDKQKVVRATKTAKYTNNISLENKENERIEIKSVSNDNDLKPINNCEDKEALYLKDILKPKEINDFNKSNYTSDAESKTSTPFVEKQKRASLISTVKGKLLSIFKK